MCSGRAAEAERVDSARSYVRASDGVKCREARMQTPARELIDEGVEVTDEDILPPTPSPSMDHLHFYETGYSRNIASTQF
ncbi:hypothetical protein Ciccas_004171 [Cichlidogyrus casuarinus]|uniref:Uncharacterized protein n=1 Tax=Cichlidogyrus casuarinus TaxID=1844966 RepID=A0ABD2QCC0_9PLAT